jgi:hypothetical protein
MTKHRIAVIPGDDIGRGVELCPRQSIDDCMRIVDLSEIVVPIKSEIRNAYVNFSEMTVSVVALIMNDRDSSFYQSTSTNEHESKD